MSFNFPIKDHQIHINPTLSLELKEVVEKRVKNHFDSKPLIWIMSSGTSSTHQSSFKLIGLSEKALLASAKAVNQYLEVSNSDCWINVLPTFHVGGLSIFYRSHLSQSNCLNLWNPQFKWNPHIYTKSIHDSSSTLSALVPTQIFDIIQNQIPAPSSLRAVVVGGARLSEELYKSARALGWPLLPSFGMTELCSQVATSSLKSLERSSITQSEFNYPKLEVLSIHEAKIDEQNILYLRSSSLLSGYYSIINGVAGEWINPLDTEGWLQTQDRAEIEVLPNNNQTLNILSRTDEVVKVLGENVNLASLRNRLYQILIKNSDFKECTIVAIPHERNGHQLWLVGDLPMNELHKTANLFNAEALPFENIKVYPTKIHIEKNSLGKIQHNLIANSISSRSH